MMYQWTRSPVDAPTLVSRERFSETLGVPMYDAKDSMTLCTPVPGLKRMTYASSEEMVSDAWVSPTTVELRLLVATAKARKMRADGPCTCYA